MLRLIQVIIGLVFVVGCSTAPVSEINREPAKSPPNADKFARKHGIAIPDNPGVAEVTDEELLSNKFKKVYAISDAHGDLEMTRKVLLAAKVIDSSDRWVAGNSLLVIAGDSIDKGPDSIGVLKLFHNLTEEADKFGGRVIHVMGNHEAGFLDDPKNAKRDPKAVKFIAQIHNTAVDDKDDKCTVKTKKDDDDDDDKDYQSVKQYWFNWCRPLAKFLRTMPVAARVGRYIFSHSGRYPAMSWNEFKNTAKDITGKKEPNGGNYSDKFISSEKKSIVTAFDWTRGERNDATEEVSESLLKAGLYGTAFGHQGGVFKLKGKIGARTYTKGQQPVLFIKLDTGHGNNETANRNEYVGAAVLIFHSPSDLTKPASSNMQLEAIDEKGGSEKIQIKSL